MILVIDNYDSFTYNLVQYLGILGQEIRVVRNDQASISELAELGAKRLVISPGPGRPEDSGICLEAIRYFSGKIPVLGVCLGHQCIGQVFGMDVGLATEPVHGKTTEINHCGTDIFSGIPQDIKVTRYHSLVVLEGSPAIPLDITARTPDGIVMALKHQEHLTFGVQFHPESVATEYGLELLKNFVNLRN